MSSRRLVFVTLALVLTLGAAGGWYLRHTALAPVDADAPVDPLVQQLQALIVNYRKVIVLLADEGSLSGTARVQATHIGQSLFRADQEQQELVANELGELIASGDNGRYQRIEAVLDYVEVDDRLYDGDQLAFREPLLSIQEALTADGSRPARKLNRRVGRDIHALDGIEQQYNNEFEQLFSRSQNHLAPPVRTKWNLYVSELQAVYQRDQIFKEYGVIMPAPAAASAPSPVAAIVPPERPEEKEAHIFGDKFPPKVIALTFDDGPHPKYTAQIVAILQHYHVPGTFFEIGHNIGTIDASGRPVLNKNADITRMLLAKGYTVGNHSYTHPVLSKEKGAQLLAEINNTDLLLKAIDPNRAPIFRFPYGAHNPEAMAILAQDHLQSVLWNVDSLDWADPIPNSVADRVLRGVDQVGHGIILFHDIHDRAVKALPGILDHLIADGYQFAGWDGQGFSVPAGGR